MNVTHPERIAITGIGTLSAFGEGRDALWNGVVGGDLRFARSSRYESKFLGLECPNLDIRRILKRGSLARVPKVSQYALIALKHALDEANLVVGKSVDSERIGICYGTSNGPASATQEIYDDILSTGVTSVKPRVFQESVFNAPSSLSSIHFSIKGPITVTPNGICAGAYALFQAQMLLAQSHVDVVVALCSEELCEAVQTALHNLRYFCNHPETDAPVRPYSTAPKGALMSEGASAIVLERWDHVKARSQPILAELAGVSCSNDAHRLGLNAPNGRGLATAILMAMGNANTANTPPDFILSGSGCTKNDDCLEQAALHHTLNSACPPQSSTRGVLGVAMGTSMMFDIAIGVEALHRRILPPTTGLGEIRAGMSSPVVSKPESISKLDSILVNSIGINGIFGAAILRGTS